ncbi:LexA family transcriptional regulator [Hymenobacter fodinae]|uniref:LexA family transcriptional regulator n=1 Tax=Hymenobacter fodinae TaxID=2510796 RepID=A0A4Z0P739_9BACT|nr:LexA family transcriptional regulator [Hymenobacter fodinae]TGE07745.1 LexA family transcriptional regulator [Hymenobacter fodinae]
MKTPDHETNQATRLKKLRRLAGLSQEAAARQVGVSDASISLYEKDETMQIKMPVLKKLAEIYHTTPEYIETGVRTGKESFNSMPTRIIVTNNQQKAQTLMVPVKAEAGYRKSFNDEEYLGTLPTYSLPGFEHGNYRMFEVSGNSMMPNFEPGDIVICEFVDSASEIVDGTVYVIVTTDGICLKRVTNLVDKKGYLIIESDNPEFKPDLIQPDEVLEMWSYRKKLTI